MLWFIRGHTVYIPTPVGGRRCELIYLSLSLLLFPFRFICLDKQLRGWSINQFVGGKKEEKN